MAPIKLCQLNARHARKVTPEICQKAVEERIDILLLQEPYHREGKIIGFGSDAKIAYKLGTDPWAAIVILNPNICTLQLTQLCSTHFAVIEITVDQESIYLVSGYFQRRDEIEVHHKSLDKILTKLRGKKVIMSIDSNANSPLWGPKATDAKGEKLEDFINDRRLEVINNPRDIATVASEVGEGWPDVTLATNNISAKIKEWRVQKGWTSSDHRAIVMEITAGVQTGRRYEQDETYQGYYLAKADWQKFEAALHSEYNEEDGIRITSRASLIEKLKSLLAKLKRSCDKAIPKRKK